MRDFKNDDFKNRGVITLLRCERCFETVIDSSLVSAATGLDFRNNQSCNPNTLVSWLIRFEMVRPLMSLAESLKYD